MLPSGLRLSVGLFGLTLSVTYNTVFAFPFPFQDARTAAMGGVGVAIDVRNAPFANPALMATNDESYDWIVMLPSKGEIESKSEDFDSNLAQFQADAPGLSDKDAQARLDAIDQDTYLKSDINAVTLVIPNETISAVAFYKKINYESAQVKVGTVGQGPVEDKYNSIVEHRAISVQEQGVSLARLVHDPYILPIDDVMLGVNVKLSLIQAYGYDESVLVGSSVLDTDQVVDQTGAVNFDIGFAKEFGVWKIGFVVKDIFRFEHEYGDSGENYVVKPLVRAGFAYRSRKTQWEFDADLTENEAVVHKSASKYLAAGFEHELFSGFHLRLGVRKNTVGDELLTRTFGFGVNYFDIEINYAVIENDEEKGNFAQLIVEF